MADDNIPVEAQNVRADETLQYQGYQPLNATDFPFPEDVEAGRIRSFLTGTVDSAFLREFSKSSINILVLSVIFLLAFVVIAVWQGLIAACKIRLLCDLMERSTEPGEIYRFRTIPFRIPTAYIWMGLTIGTVGLILFSLITFTLLRRSVGTAHMVQQATIVGKGSNAILSWQFISALVPMLSALLLVGFGINWQTGGTLLLGFLICSFVCFIQLSLGTRGSVRVLTAAHESLRASLTVALRVGAAMSLSTLSLAAVGLSLLYLITRDVRSLFGFSLGSALFVLFIRLSGEMFKKSLELAVEKICSTPRDIALRDNKTPPRLTTFLSAAFADFSGPAISFFENYVTSVTCTAALGSGLAFVYRNKFAMCIFNHLHIEQTCGPFGYPQNLGYATFICKSNGLYLEYPQLSTWASNTAFVAVPFILAAITLLAAILTATYIRLGPAISRTGLKKSELLQNLQSSLRLNVLSGSIIIVACSAAVFYGLFGPNSEFQRFSGLGSDPTLQRMELDGRADQCLSISLGDSLGTNPLPLPQGGELVSGKYNPVYPSGLSFGNASSVSWRLFICHLIGVFLSLLAFLYFSIITFHKQFAERASKDAFLTIQQGFRVCLPSLIFPFCALLAGVLGTYKLFGAYGVAIAAQGFMSCFGICITSHGMSLVCRSADQNAKLMEQTSFVQNILQSLRLFHNRLQTTLSQILIGAYSLTSICIFFVAIEHAGILPSPQDLTGSPELSPTRFISDLHVASLHDLFIVLGMYIGVGIPFFVAGSFFISVRPYFVEVINKLFRQDEKFLEGWKEPAFPRNLTIDSVRETLDSFIVVVAIPLAVGFGLGRRALLGMMLSVLGISHLLGAFLLLISEAAKGARDFVETGEVGTDNVSVWGTKSVDRVAEVLGFSSGVSSTVHASGKVVAVVSLVGIVRMREGSWSGGVLLAGFLLLLLALIYWNWRRRAQMKDRGMEDMEVRSRNIPAPQKKISPFYEHEPTIDSRYVLPGSQMRAVIEKGERKTTVRAMDLARKQS